ncbi:MAG: Phosphoribosylaminoimidazole-succinocarboxamide synthase [Deltaproteobacteria bacterium ADurb.Bin510]|nr:MAG: Phosphoribosylaminoimidazole-succinocarboxamide synthase [Deltaproteobacteria bacterium ADurb.Bin510]
MSAISDIKIPGAKLLSSGKVREIFEADENHLLLVTTDRLSAFDVILPDPIPDKGKVLNQISLFWFEQTKGLIKNHIVSADVNEYPEPFKGDERLQGRSVLVRKAKPLAIECIVRGYITGSGWKEYQASGSVCGIQLPAGLKESDKLPEPIFTPSTKAEIGQHDENIDEVRAAALVGREVFEQVKAAALGIYKQAAEYALGKGIIIADTKFEFGLTEDGLILIDEVLTPDSSRFWPLSEYQPGKSQPSYDKQFVRDYLETLDWNKQAPGPRLPEDIILKTRAKYVEAYEKLTGKTFA